MWGCVDVPKNIIRNHFETENQTMPAKLTFQDTLLNSSFHRNNACIDCEKQNTNPFTSVSSCRDRVLRQWSKCEGKTYKTTATRWITFFLHIEFFFTPLQHYMQQKPTLWSNAPTVSLLRCELLLSSSPSFYPIANLYDEKVLPAKIGWFTELGQKLNEAYQIDYNGRPGHPIAAPTKRHCGAIIEGLRGQFLFMDYGVVYATLNLD